MDAAAGASPLVELGATGDDRRWHDAIETPVGPIVVVARGAPQDALIVAVRFGAPGRGDGSPAPGASISALDEACRQLLAYFRGARAAFTLPLAPLGTPFQRRVWRALGRIPYGATATYGDVARWLGQPAAVRAVGAANGANPLAIVVPCHRVIGANGRLVGYGGGLPRKRWLLAHEAGHADWFAGVAQDRS